MARFVPAFKVIRTEIELQRFVPAFKVRFLVVVPASTLHNWLGEMQRFVPAFKVINDMVATFLKCSWKKKFVLDFFQLSDVLEKNNS